MKAIQYRDFGSSDVLQQVETPMPSITNDNELLIKVKAASINPIDMKIRNGFMKQIRPVEMPFIPGGEAAGIIAEVGSAVTGFKIGDEVIAVTMKNAYAEYIVASQDFVLLKPQEISFPEAASVAVNLAAAQSLLFVEGKLQRGQRLLIQGAGGAAGAAMVQLAKNAGAYVIGTATGAGLALVKSLGADEVFDYKVQDVTQLVNDIDLVADTAGGNAQSDLFKVLKPGGTLLSIGAMPPQDLADKYKVHARFVVSDLSAKTWKNGLDLVKTGLFKPIVSKIFPLAEAATAQDFLSAGGVNGKVVLIVN